MSWSDFQEDAFNLTEKEVKLLTRKAINEYRSAQVSLEAQLKKTYLNILATVGTQDYYNEVIKYDRLKNLLAQVRREYTTYSVQAEILVSQSSRISFYNVYYRKIYAASWLVPEILVGSVPSKLAELTIMGTEKAWKEITAGIIAKYGDKSNYQPQAGTVKSFLVNNRKSELNKIQSAITQGFIQGKTYPQMRDSITNVIGRELKDRKGQTRIIGAMANSIRIIRTESNRLMNAGSYAASKDAVSQDIDIKRMLRAVLDNRTRAQSASMDGQKVGVDEPFIYPGGVTAIYPGTTGIEKFDINDREYVVDIVEGISPVVRLGRNPVTGKNQTFDMTDFPEWAELNGLKKNKFGQYYKV